MQLAAKLVSALIAALVLLLGIEGYLSLRRETASYRAEMRSKAQLLGHAMQGLVLDVWRTSGETRALELIADANREERLVQIRWVWLDAVAGGRYRPRVPYDELGRVRQGIEASFEGPFERGGSVLVTYFPIRIGGPQTGALELSESLSRLSEYTRAAIARIAELTGVLFVVGGLVVFVLGAGFVGRPLRQLTAQVQRIGQGDLTHPLHLRGHDEFARLAAAMNTMCDQLADSQDRVRHETSHRIAALDQLRHSDRLKTVGQLAAGLAHELGSPLGVVSIRAKLIAAGGLTEEEVRENTTVIQKQSERMADIIRQLLAFARPRAPKTTEVDLRQIAAQTIDVLASFGQSRNVTLRLVGDEEPVLAKVDAGQIQQVLTNLIVNAIQAMPRGGAVDVGVGRERTRPPEEPQGPPLSCPYLYVVDEGQGIPRENISRLFEPFFTTKDVNEGTGLGLSIAHGIVKEHGGWIEVASTPGQGSRFSVYLPPDCEP